MTQQVRRAGLIITVRESNGALSFSCIFQHDWSADILAASSPRENAGRMPALPMGSPGRCLVLDLGRQLASEKSAHSPSSLPSQERLLPDRFPVNRRMSLAHHQQLQLSSLIAHFRRRRYQPDSAVREIQDLRCSRGASTGDHFPRSMSDSLRATSTPANTSSVFASFVFALLGRHFSLLWSTRRESCFCQTQQNK